MSNTDLIHKFIVDELLLDPDESLGLDDELLAAERIDSLGLMRLIAFIGEQFGVEVPYDEILIENFRDVRTIDAYVATKVASAIS